MMALHRGGWIHASARWLGIAILCICAWQTHAAVQPHRCAYYTGTKFGLSMTYMLQLSRVPADTPDVQWMRLPPEQALQLRPYPQQDWVHVALRYGMFGNSTRIDSLLDAEHGLAIQRIVQRPRDTYISYKATRYGDRGVRFLKLRDPAPLQEVDWQAAKPSSLSYPKGFEGGSTVSDATALFYHATQRQMRQGDRITLPILNDDQLLLAQIRAGRVVRVDTDFIETSDNDTRHVQESRRARRLLISASPLDPAADGDGMSLLGIDGELEMFVDYSLGVPLSIAGQVAMAGDVVLALRRLETYHRIPSCNSF